MKKESHYIIHEVTRVKLQLYYVAFVIIMLIIILFIINDGLKLLLIKPRTFFISIVLPICILLIIFILPIIKELRSLPNKKAVVFSIDKEGVLLKVKGKRIKIKSNSYIKHKKDSFIYTEDQLMCFEWRDIEYIGVRFLKTGNKAYWNLYVWLSGADKNSDKIKCVYVKSKTKGEIWCSLEDYILWLPLSTRRIRRVIYECTGRTDLFVDETIRHK